MTEKNTSAPAFVREFLSKNYKGRVIMAREYLDVDAEWGAGMIVSVASAHPFLLQVIKDFHLARKGNVYGDIDALMRTTGEMDEHQLDEIRRQRDALQISNRRRSQLENILSKRKK